MGCLTRRFRHLVARCGLPPVRLHDLRHGAATLAHAAGADLKAVQAQLGHTSMGSTPRTCTRSPAAAASAAPVVAPPNAEVTSSRQRGPGQPAVVPAG